MNKKMTSKGVKPSIKRKNKEREQIKKMYNFLKKVEKTLTQDSKEVETHTKRGQPNTTKKIMRQSTTKIESTNAMQCLLRK